MVLLLAAVSLSARAECPCAALPPFPAWVFGHIVWFDESTSDSVSALVADYKARGIPVDGVIIDSPWETAYNTFEPDPKLYPDMKKLIDDLHAQDVRVIFWITPNVNRDDPEYQFVRDQGFFLRGMEDRAWWKGPGGWIDYDNPEAMAWWHRRMDKAIALGLDGWKTDGTDPYVLLQGWGARQKYAAQYYSDFYDYTRQKTGGREIIMARPYESGIDEATFGLPGWTNPLGLALWLKFAPIDKSWASWVGDQDPTFDGMTIARRRILYSARRNYLILGSDIGGYREIDGQGPSKEVLIRWAQFGAFCPFMENGGGGEHRPWRFDEDTLRIYRTAVLLHKALLPYLYSTAIEKWGEGRSMIQPLRLGKDEYLLGNDILVAPVTRAGGKVRVVLPRGDDWFPLFADDDYLRDAKPCLIAGAAAPLLRGGCSFTRVYPLAQFPVFFRAGALIPVLGEYARPLLGADGGDGAAGAAAPCRPMSGGTGGRAGAGGCLGVVLMAPVAPGRAAVSGRVIYMEGREPVEAGGRLDGDGGISASVTVPADSGWYAMPVPPGFPRLP
jgi:alpha-glucosidase (family GH31 glycosyl hydrolase)